MMFVSRKRYECDRDSDGRRFYRLSELYWELRRKHDRLLETLGLHEETINKTVLRKKGGPEEGE